MKMPTLRSDPQVRYLKGLFVFVEIIAAVAVLIATWFIWLDLRTSLKPSERPENHWPQIVAILKGELLTGAVPFLLALSAIVFSERLAASFAVQYAVESQEPKRDVSVRSYRYFVFGCLLAATGPLLGGLALLPLQSMAAVALGAAFTAAMVPVAYPTQSRFVAFSQGEFKKFQSIFGKDCRMR